MSGFNTFQRIHFIGVGGIGMSAVARLLLKQGYTVTGSDLRQSSITENLVREGAQVFIGHDSSCIAEADCIVVSSAIQDSNPEYQAAVERSCPILTRAEALACVMGPFKHKIMVAGTHGKTTTSAMIATVLRYGSRQGAFAVGAILNDVGSNAEMGEQRDYFVAEADESDGSFLSLDPTLAVITNIEEDHMEYFKTAKNLTAHFEQFLKKVQGNCGTVFINKDDQVAYDMACQFPPELCRFFSIQSSSDVKAKNVSYLQQGIAFDLELFGQDQGRIQLRCFGWHNVYNALAAISVCVHEAIPVRDIVTALESFSGTKRRLEFLGEYHGISFYDDYGHHPTEIKTTLEGLKRSMDKPIVCIFQPHKYSRTQHFLDDFSESFYNADEVIITDIYSANEANPNNVSSRAIVDSMRKKSGQKVSFISEMNTISGFLVPSLNQDKVVVTMGAGDIHLVSQHLIHDLKQQKTRH